MVTASITNSWQVHIPAAIRKEIGLSEPTQVRVVAKDKKIILEPIKNDILSLAGKYKDRKPVKPVDLDNFRDHIDYSEW